MIKEAKSKKYILEECLETYLQACKECTIPTPVYKDVVRIPCNDLASVALLMYMKLCATKNITNKDIIDSFIEPECKIRYDSISGLRVNDHAALLIHEPSQELVFIGVEGWLREFEDALSIDREVLEYALANKLYVPDLIWWECYNPVVCEAMCKIMIGFLSFTREVSLYRDTVGADLTSDIFKDFYKKDKLFVSGDGRFHVAIYEESCGTGIAWLETGTKQSGSICIHNTSVKLVGTDNFTSAMYNYLGKNCADTPLDCINIIKELLEESGNQEIMDKMIESVYKRN